MIIQGSGVVLHIVARVVSCEITWYDAFCKKVTRGNLCKRRNSYGITESSAPNSKTFGGLKQCHVPIQ